MAYCVSVGVRQDSSSVLCQCRFKISKGVLLH